MNDDPNFVANMNTNTQNKNFIKAHITLIMVVQKKTKPNHHNNSDRSSTKKKKIKKLCFACLFQEKEIMVSK